ncbi:phage portal protein [Azospirillum cavernae]|uniref:Phage portal protein n=2 Tax=Azospirillum cavernae TaxID=2320860 RepID=A0A418VZ39_9PROT|nr:phage portal protein [Azospirillum cavernae]
MLVGGGDTPYDAADSQSQHMEGWRPFLWAPDSVNMYRDRIVSRARDLAVNDGWASGAITRILDNAVGATFRPIAKPDYRALALMTGNKGFDASWADAFGRAVEAGWRTWADDPGHYCDAQRQRSMAQIFRLAFRHKLVDGDALAGLPWMPERVGRGRAKYCTVVQLIDPDRLSNPQVQFDQRQLRGGVEIDEHGAAVAYHIRRAHQGDWFAAADSVTWQRIPRETDWGRPIIVHDFDADRADQHRGGAGVLTPVVQRLKMLIKYDGTELDAAIINAIFAAYVQSPFDPALVEAALGDDGAVGAYQTERANYHKERRTTLNGARMPILFPGESINTVSAARPNSNFADFEGAVLRNAAAGIGISAQQLSNDWSDVNYSSARAALLEAWKTLTRRRTDFAVGFGSPVYCAILEEMMEVDNLPMPSGVVPDYLDARGAYSRCRWMGPGRGWIDPVAEKQGAVLGMDAALSTLEEECAENTGQDWEEVLDQRAREMQGFKERGLEPPSWAKMNIPANQAAAPPKKPDAQ